MIGCMAPVNRMTLTEATRFGSALDRKFWATLLGLSDLGATFCLTEFLSGLKEGVGTLRPYSPFNICSSKTGKTIWRDGLS